MEAWQAAALVAGIGMLVLLWPAARRIGGSRVPMLRWALIWAVAIAAVMLAYTWVLAPMGIGLR